MKRAFFDKMSRNIVQKVVILCDFHVTETYGHIIVTRMSPLYYIILSESIVLCRGDLAVRRDVPKTPENVSFHTTRVGYLAV